MIVTSPRSRALGRVLAAAPSLIVAAGFVASVARTSVSKSLVEAIGAAGIAWTAGIIIATTLAGLLELCHDPRRPRPWLLRTGIVVHIASATLLAGYGVAVLFGPTTPWITIGLVFAAAVLHLGRWRRIATEEIPAVELVAAISKETTR